MKAFRIYWAENEGTLVDLRYKYQFPRVECHTCYPKAKGYGNGSFEYPCFRFEFLNEKEFNFDRILTVAEFERLRLRIQQAAGWPVTVKPGGSLGQIFGNSATRNLNDFIWGFGLPQISRRACDLLAKEGVNLMTAEADIRYRGKKLDSHLAIQVEIVQLLTLENLQRFTISHCANCGGFKKEDVRIQPPGYEPNSFHIVIPEGYIIRKSAWPKGHHLVQSEETLKEFASEEFMAAVKKHNLTGIAFIETGSFV